MPPFFRSRRLEPCSLLLFSFVRLFIPPSGLWFPLLVLWKTINFGGCIQQGALQLWLTWFNMICSVSICARSGGNCSCSSHRFYFEGCLEQASSSWVPELPGSDVGWELVFLHTGDVGGDVTHYHVVLFDTFFLRAVGSLPDFLKTPNSGHV